MHFLFLGVKLARYLLIYICICYMKYSLSDLNTEISRRLQ